MWDELRVTFANRHMNEIKLGNDGMALYYQKNPMTQMTLAIWLICDRELHSMGKIQYRDYLKALHGQFQDRLPNFQLLTIAMTDDREYCDMLCRVETEDFQYGYWIVDPKYGTFEPYAGPQMDSFPWVQQDVMNVVMYERTRVESGGFPDWRKRALWRDPKSVTEAERNLWRSGKQGKPVVTLWLIGINVAIFLITCVFAMDTSYGIVRGIIKSLTRAVELGGSSWHDAIERGQIYRLVTSVFLHAGIDHITGNMVALFAFGDAIESYLKNGRRYLTLYMIAGVLSAFFSNIWRMIAWDDKYIQSVGASGAIFGLMGAVLMLMLRHKDLRKSRHGVPVWAILAYVAYSIAVPLVTAWIMDAETTVDLAAHVGGFIIGAIIFCIYDKKIEDEKKAAAAEMV